MLAVRLAGTNDLRCRVNHLSLHGVSDRTVCFTAEDLGDRVPVGTYSLERGEVSYGRGQERDWRMSFSKGPQATVEADKTVEVALGQPTLTIRAVNESERYNAEAKESAVFKKGTTIYFEPRIVGSSQEVLNRFRRASGDGGKTTDAPPKVRITSASGKELLAKTMEYG
jgi:hypothetical protein